VRRGAFFFAATALVVCAAGAGAQTRPPARPQPPPPPAGGLSVRGYGEAGIHWFAASKTFDAVLGSSTGPIFGGGVEALWNRKLSISFDVSRFQATGERVFVFDDEVFPLGIETSIDIVPIAVNVAYRLERPRSSITPFVGGGINWHRYSETSDFAAAGEDVSATYTGIHALGGAEWRVSRYVAVGGVARWMSVRDALGAEPTSAASAFDEHDLGGFDFRVRIVVGR
jgi:opacity protein-like surface antigen